MYNIDHLASSDLLKVLSVELDFLSSSSLVFSPPLIVDPRQLFLLDALQSLLLFPLDLRLSRSLLSLTESLKVLLDHGDPVDGLEVPFLGQDCALKVIVLLDQILHLVNVSPVVEVDNVGFSAGHPALHGISVLKIIT